MANSKYTQVATLLAQGKLNWVGDQILACLVSGATFDAANTVLSQVGAMALYTSPVQGRWVTDAGEFMGNPAVFMGVTEGRTYQMILVQNTNDGDPKTLAWYDIDENDATFTIDNTGTLIIRPSVLVNIPEGQPSDSRVWMTV